MNGLSPSEINKDNEADVWAFMYLKRRRGSKTRPTFHLKLGDLVRISLSKHVFRRAYQEQYTSEVFRVTARLLKQGIPMYKLQDLRDDGIKGLFYSCELQKVDKDENSLWFIESILKKRKRNKWQGFNSTFNSWVDGKDVKDVSSNQ